MLLLVRQLTTFFFLLSFFFKKEEMRHTYDMIFFVYAIYLYRKTKTIKLRTSNIFA